MLAVGRSQSASRPKCRCQQKLRSRPLWRTWQQEHLALANVDILELVSVDYAQQHRAFVLEEPFLRRGRKTRARILARLTAPYLGLVDVVVVALIGSTDGHYCKVATVVDAEVIYWGLKQVLVLRGPAAKVQWRTERHYGRTRLRIGVSAPPVSGPFNEPVQGHSIHVQKPCPLQ